MASRASENQDLARRAVIHDVSQMLAVIAGRADLLLRRAGDRLDRDDLEAMALAAADAAAMLRRLKDPGASLPPATCNLDREIRRVALVVAPSDGEGWDRSGTGEGLRPLDLNVDANLHAAVPGQVVREILTNLFLNALEAMPEQGGLTVVSTVRGEKAVLRVADQGPGLAPGMAEHLFSRDASTGKGPGRGIGLAGCRELLGRHDGGLTYLADQGPGAVFEVELPLGVAPSEPTGSTQEDHLEGAKVLIVDDEPEVRSVLTDLLGEMGCRVSVARDAATGREVHAAEEFDVVMIDLTLPDAGGLELAAELRAADGVTAIVVMTGVDRGDALDVADPASVDFRATKPMAWNRIKELVTSGARLARDRRLRKEV